MRLAISATGIMILCLGMRALGVLPKQEGIAFFQGALTLGGGLVICALFTFRMPWHGIMGAGVLALLGMVRGIGNLPKFLPPNTPDSSAYFELATTALSSALFVLVIKALFLEKKRRHIKDLHES